MSLRLSIENVPVLPDGGPTSILIAGEQGIEIGREGYVDWVLPDPYRVVSGRHCEIRFRDGHYWLEDLSTNGTFVNSNPKRLRAPHRLSDGDRIEIGHYIIRVDEIADAADAASADETIMRGSHRLWESAGQRQSPRETPPVTPHAASDRKTPGGMARTAVPPPSGAMSGSSDLAGRGTGTNVTVPPHESPPSVPRDRGRRGARTGAELLSQEPQHDVPDRADAGPGADAAAQAGEPLPIAEVGLGVGGPGGGPGDGPVKDAALPPPETSQSAASSPDANAPVIDATIPPRVPSQHGDLEQSAREPEPNAAVPSPEPSPLTEPDLEAGEPGMNAAAPPREPPFSSVLDDQPGSPATRVEEPVHQPPLVRSVDGSPEPLSAPPDDTGPAVPRRSGTAATPALGATPPSEAREPFERAFPPSAPAPRPGAEDTGAGRRRLSSKQAAPSVSASADMNAAFLRRFAAGAGLDPAVLEGRDAGDLAELLGLLMQVCAFHVNQLLVARAQFQRTARTRNQTDIRLHDNNPLRWLPSSQEALAIMFGRPTRSYLGPQSAFEHSFAALKAHQMDTFAAVQDAIQDLLADLDPAVIDEQAGENASRGFLFRTQRTRKARLWDEYVARWTKKTGVHEGRLFDAFMTAFSEAYDRRAD